MEVELVYMPTANKVIRKKIPFFVGLTISDVLNQTGFAKAYPEVLNYSFGIFSTPATMDTRVNAGDRVEIYRPLLIDPKEKRRQRVK